MYVFFIIPVTTIIIATILPFIPWEALPLIWYPIFWEIFTALYILLSFIPLGFLLVKKVTIFDKENEAMNKIYLRYIASNRQIDLLANELQYFFEDFIKEYTNEVENEEWSYASQFLIILQNHRIIDQIIKNPFTIQTIIDTYKKDKRNQFTYDEQEFLEKIILWSFADNDSFLTHELRGNLNIDPSNHNGIILRKIVEDLWFLKKLNIIWEWKTHQYDKNIIFVKNYLIFTARIHEEFRNKTRLKENHRLHQLLFHTFKTQADIIARHFKNLDYIELKSLLWNSFEYELWELKDALLQLYGNKFPEIFLNQKAPYWWEYHYLDSNKSLIDAYAFGIFELFEAFTWHREDTRDFTIEFDFFRNEEIILKEIETRMILLFKQAIPENLDGHSAPVSRIFWDNYYWDILNTTDKINENKEIVGIVLLYASKLPKLAEWYIYAYTEETLKDPYKKEKALEKSRKIISDLFPKYIDYDKENNLLNIYDYERLSFRSIDLAKTLRNKKVEIKK